VSLLSSTDVIRDGQHLWSDLALIQRALKRERAFLAPTDFISGLRAADCKTDFGMTLATNLIPAPHCWGRSSWSTRARLGPITGTVGSRWSVGDHAVWDFAKTQRGKVRGGSRCFPAFSRQGPVFFFLSGGLESRKRKGFCLLRPGAYLLSGAKSLERASRVEMPSCLNLGYSVVKIKMGGASAPRDPIARIESRPQKIMKGTPDHQLACGC